MRQLIAATTDPSLINPSLTGYQRTVATHCPFLGPSISQGLTTWSSYEATFEDCPDVLALLAENAEQLRVDRRTRGPLVCRNIALHGPADISSAQKVMDWPAWIIRNLYAPVQIMIGRFWIGEERADKLGRAVPVPPISFFSLRHSFATRDARFLSAFPVVEQRLANSNDDDRDVLMPWLGKPLSAGAIREGYSELVRLFAADRKANT